MNLSQLSAGRASTPPIKGLGQRCYTRVSRHVRSAYPIVAPMLQTMGRKANPCARLVSSVSSPSIDFKTPTFPFSRPTRDRLATRAGKVRERPKQSIESVRPSNPTNTTGLRPILSDSIPHCRTNRVSTRKNVDCCPDWSSAGGRDEEERAYYDPCIITGPVRVSFCNTRLVYQLKNKREDDGGGDRLTELHE